ncbi:hypothetical protein B8W95_13170, partial [Staphylococcus pasteuri]
VRPLRLASEDVDDRSEQTGEGLLAEGGDAQPTLAGLGADSRSTRSRVDEGQLCTSRGRVRNRSASGAVDESERESPGRTAKVVALAERSE